MLSSLHSLVEGSYTSNTAALTNFEPVPPEIDQDNPPESNPCNVGKKPNSVSTGVIAEDKERDTFYGWMTISAISPLTFQTFTPKPWEETDVDIAIEHCGVCGSDLHTMRSGWGQALYPCCLGHEIVGKVIRVGKNARSGIEVGSRVGVGPPTTQWNMTTFKRPKLTSHPSPHVQYQNTDDTPTIPECYTCRSPSCTPCSTSHENYCPHRVATYSDRYPNGTMSYGGFADRCRHNSYSVHSIPDGLASEDAAVMLCAGATVYEPMVEYLEHRYMKREPGQGTSVGIVGLGGLGHLGVLFARALGFDHIVAISRSQAKRADALALGADSYVATSDEGGWAESHASSLDLIICTVSSRDMPLKEYLGLLKPRGRFCQVGIPEAPLPQLDAMALVLNGTSICFSDSASPANVQEMLKLAARKGIKAWTQIRRMDEVNEVMKEMERGEARFRFVLENRKDCPDGNGA